MRRGARALAPCTSALVAAVGACGDPSPLAGGPESAEDAALVAIVEAYQADDCARVEALAAGFVASTDLRLHAVTTYYGRCRYAREDDAGAVALLSRVAYAEPPDAWVPTALYWLGRARLRGDDAATAASDLERLRARFAHDDLVDDASYHLGKAQLALGDPGAAIATFAEVLARPDASALRRAGATYQTALAYVARAHGDPASPDLESAFTWLGTVRASFATSIYADNAAYRQGRVRYDQGRLFEAAALLEGALDAWPDSAWRPAMGWILGSARYELGQLASALEAFAIPAADAQSIYHDNALYFSGRAWYRQASADAPERYAAARQWFLRVLGEHPDSVYADNAAYFAARCDYEREDLAAAEAGFEQLLARHPASPYVDNALSYLVRLRVALGDCDGAAAALRTLDAAAPGGSYATSARAFFEASACATP